MIKFAPNSAFTLELRNEVERYFIENKINIKGTYALYFKTAFWISLALACYTVLIFIHPESLWINVPLCCFFGISLAGIGFNVMHDAAHGSYSKNVKVNRFFACSLDVMGASSDIWHRKHNGTHHGAPNTDHDDDIQIAPLFRLHANEQWHWWHIFQTLYMWPLYAIEYAGWVLIFDFKKYFTGKVCNAHLRFTFKKHLFFWGGKVFYVVVFFVVPIKVIGWSSTIGYGIIAGVCGFLISVVFQLAHIHEKALFPISTLTEKEGVVRIEKENAIHQLETTANFAPNNRFVSWFVGGLNFQIEHHLFPNISHIHYPRIRPIVKAVCERHNVKYNEFKTLIGALISHVKHMWKMSFA